MFERVSNLARANAPRLRGLRTVLVAAMLAVATLATTAQVRDDHPDHYVVKRGDTLWDIAGRFLRKPWLWPEIWQANPQIRNPHLIYPGDVISLAYLDRVAVQQGPRSEAPVNAVPLSEVEPFLKDLRVVPEIDSLPYVVGLEDNRMRGIEGHVAYIRGLENAQPGQRYLVVRAQKRYRMINNNGSNLDQFDARDLDSRGQIAFGLSDGSLWDTPVYVNHGTELLGYELMTQTTATVTRGASGPDQLVTLMMDAEGRDVRVGDRIIPVEAQTYDLQFFPHPPKQQAAYGRLSVMAVADGYRTGGTHDVIAISGGAREGIDNGTVFSIWRRGDRTVDRVRADPDRDSGMTSARNHVRLPDEFAGHAMVFRTFDNISYALVMNSVKPSRVGYELKNPDATE
ncbi:LysM peptidoglycan-binding domain-containing protein [Thermomonas sp.]|uniref:LysM peptidoglycan-binding domain-containing protein n=1 Tax=Thermomonas sp. TaxID=1971895 RepID=UPI001D469C7D|nr:LysM peptidoglycan-binding domain-containing protein [Thermomonas sp.]MBZ0087929.1 LysM peptidoglycan-binding domain-containing protein [Thermomonas sp.]MCO5055475.1 LysM peptidoglycan-binding domain-containing protein [Thermomonas sp.]HRO62620.1 LysM peptidoglycan-binding domain-containing protein [Thermomonas sp.]